MTIEFPENVKKLYKIFKKNGYELYAVGGAVRDALLKRDISDIDFCTNATPSEMLKMFPYAIKTGIKHGTLTIPLSKQYYEVTTYRIDGKYTDSRHPNNVIYSSSLKEDLSRRDFTINAMAANIESGEIIDLFSGRDDLRNKIIRTVGDPFLRFQEDALRMLRAIRFSAKLGFRIEEKTFDAIKELSCTLTNISKERIKTEIWGTLEAKDVKKGLEYLLKTALDKAAFPFLNFPNIEVINTLSIDEKGSAINRFVELLYITKTGLDGAKQEVDFLKCSNFEKDKILHLYKCTLVDIHTMKDEYRKRNFLSLLKRENFDAYFDILKELNYHSYSLKEKFIPFLSSPLSKNELDIKGDDLVKIGLQGEMVGKMLNKCLERVLEDPKLNNKNDLLKIVKEFNSNQVQNE